MQTNSSRHPSDDDEDDDDDGLVFWIVSVWDFFCCCFSCYCYSTFQLHHTAKRGAFACTVVKSYVIFCVNWNSHFFIWIEELSYLEIFTFNFINFFTVSPSRFSIHFLVPTKKPLWSTRSPCMYANWFGFGSFLRGENGLEGVLRRVTLVPLDPPSFLRPFFRGRNLRMGH